jgi:glycosyltransferase involved in cell wall biosynthesis
LTNRANVRFLEIPRFFLSSEIVLSRLSRNGFNLFISPYPKLPLWGVDCPSVHIVHDVLDLTHPAYRGRLKAFFDAYRLRKALKKADLTWYDSVWSREETRRHFGSVGRNPRVRYPALSESFTPGNCDGGVEILRKHSLSPGYILAIGNGKPHKNLGLLLSLSRDIARKLVFVGVPRDNRRYWASANPNDSAIWIEHVSDSDILTLMRNAFCLAQPSTAEGYGYPPLEAMACGVPAVVSNIPVLVETTGGNAIAADTHHPREWVQAFQALEDKTQYQAHIEKGLKWVEPLKGQKGWRGNISDLEELLERNNG